MSEFDDSVKCGRRVSPYTKNNSKCLVPCSNPECTNKYSRTELEFDVSVSVSDATGTLVQCRLKGDAAEQAFAVKVNYNLLTFIQPLKPVQKSKSNLKAWDESDTLFVLPRNCN